MALVALALTSSASVLAQVSDPTPRHRKGSAGEYRVFHDFMKQPGSPRTGIAFPNTALTLAPDGYLYGTTEQSGLKGRLSNYGAIYRVGPNGRVTTVLALKQDQGGSIPSGVTAGSDGNLYGATIYGGANGDGVLFRLAPDGTYTQLFSFACLGEVGCQARGTLVEAPDGSFYGTASGSIYRLMQDGSVRVAYRTPVLGILRPRNDVPVAIDSRGVVYAVSFDSVLRLGLDGQMTVLHTLSYANEGSNITGVMLASDGNLYGTAVNGGPTNGGTLFRLNPDTGEFRMLHAFSREGSVSDNVSPQVPVQGADGMLYGTTVGSTWVDVGDKVGTIWRSTLEGSFETLMYLSPTGGDAILTSVAPPGRLTATADGRIVGPSRQGGLYGNGALFELRPATR